ncbi:MAG TPA: ABC transporter permease [Acidisarcina sp.]
MNTHANAASASSIPTHTYAPVIIPMGRLLYWSVLRELWENRSLYIAPVAAAALVLFGFLISTLRLSHTLQSDINSDAGQLNRVVLGSLGFSAMLIMAVTTIVAVFYCLDALYGERRDRSVLFWKSLPVSDLTTVLSKAMIPLVVLPLFTFVLIIVTQWIMLLISSATLLAHGMSAAPFWANAFFPQMALMLLFHLVAIHSLWYAPFYGWLLMVSAWAKRVPLLWAFLPPITISVAERIAFNSSHFASLLRSRMSGPESTAGGMSMSAMSHIDPAGLVLSPGLWIGLAVAAGFLAAAVWLRHNREAI